MTDESSNQQHWPAGGREAPRAGRRTGREEPTVRVQFAAFLLALCLLIAVSAGFGLLNRAPPDALPGLPNDGVTRLSGEQQAPGDEG